MNLQDIILSTNITMYLKASADGENLYFLGEKFGDEAEDHARNGPLKSDNQKH